MNEQQEAEGECGSVTLDLELSGASTAPFVYWLPLRKESLASTPIVLARLSLTGQDWLHLPRWQDGQPCGEWSSRQVPCSGHSRA
jgi:hypothetical protein